MNRLSSQDASASGRVPRTRGDEPGKMETPTGASQAFPARAGMNRETAIQKVIARCVPRTRGDEPALLDTLTALNKRSPHARG